VGRACAFAATKEGPLDRHRRRPSSHLAPGWTFPLAGRPDCKPRHLRSPTNRSVATIRSANTLDGFSPKVEVVKSVLCADQLGEAAFRGRNPPGFSAPPRKPAGPHAIVSYADFSADDVRPQLDRLQALFADAWAWRMQLHWHENPLYRFAARSDLCAGPDDPPQHRAGWPTTAGASTLQVFAPQDDGCRRPCRGPVRT